MENDERNREERLHEVDLENAPEAGQPAPAMPVWPRSAPREEKPAVTPSSVKIAAALVIAHGALTSLSAFQAGRNNGDLSGLPLALVWLGVTIVVGGALSDRQVWAWWFTRIFGGLAGIFNLLQILGYVMFSAGELVEGQVRFSPLFIGMAGIGMLVAVTLLGLPEARAAFGMQSAPAPSSRPRSFDETKHE
jgi:hypothetical protein